MAEPVGQASGLDLIAVSHRYGSRRAVEQVSLSVKPGEILGLLGPSGCGKSTTLRLAAGLEDLQQGEVRIGGEVVAGRGVNIPTERRHIGMVFQDHALFPHLSVADNIAFGLSRLPQAERRARAKLWADRLGLGGHFDAYPHQLSGGEQQRVALARALALDPEILFLDEPTAGLDPIGAAAFDQLILTLRDALGLSVFLVTHDLDTLYSICDRVAVLSQKRVLVADRLEVVEATDDAWIREYFHGPRGRAAEYAARQEKH